jgi:beta propeller repeat protein
VLPPLQEGLTSAARIDDGTIVWTSRAGTSPATGEPDTSVFAYDLGTRRLLAPVATFASAKRLAAFGGGRVVWFDGRDGGSTLHVRDLRLGLDTTVEAAAVANRDRHADTAALVARGQAAISGDTILWTDWTHGDGDIWRYDLGTSVAAALVRDPGRQEQPAVWGDTAAWVDGRNSLTEADGTVRDLDVYGADLRSGKEFPVCIAAGEQVHPSVSGDVIVWQDGRDRTAASPGEWNIYGYDVGTQREFIVTDTAGPQTDPVVSDDVVVWTDGPHADGRSAIMGCDLHTRRVFQISDDEGAYTSPSISGRTVIWNAQRGDGTQLAVYGATIAVSPRAITVTPLQK